MPNLFLCADMTIGYQTNEREGEKLARSQSKGAIGSEGHSGRLQINKNSRNCGGMREEKKTIEWKEEKGRESD